MRFEQCRVSYIQFRLIIIPIGDIRTYMLTYKYCTFYIIWLSTPLYLELQGCVILKFPGNSENKTFKVLFRLNPAWGSEFAAYILKI